MPCGDSRVSSFYTSESKSETCPIMSLMHEICGVALNLVPASKTEGGTWSINETCTRPRPPSWLRSLKTSAALRTNKRLYFANVALSRLWSGREDNEGLQRCETDRLKWIIRTESFCDADDTLTGSRIIKSYMKPLHARCIYIKHASSVSLQAGSV